MRWKFFCVTVFLANWLIAQPQKKIWLHLQFSHPPFRPAYIQRHADPESAMRELQKVIFQFHENSYLLASADTFFWQKDTLNVKIEAGDAFHWARLRRGNVPEEMLSAAGFREKMYRNRLFSFKQVEKLEQKIVQQAENLGYPFASVRIDSLQMEQYQLTAELHYDSGPPFRFDTLQISGTARLRPKFLSRYLRIFPGQPFSQAKIDKSTRLLTQLPFLKLTQTPEILFENQKARYIIHADRRKSNQFDGIVGLLPNETLNGNKLLFTGEVNLKLGNLFQAGKSLDVVWQQIRPLSPYLNLIYKHPVLFGTNLEANFQLYLLKQDSTFLNVNRRASLLQPLANGGKIGFSLNWQTSAALGSNSQYAGLQQLPQVLNTKMLSYGLEYNLITTDDVYYPTQGWELAVSGAVGNKIINPNAAIPKDLYENLSLSSLQVSARVRVEKFIPAGKRNTFVWRGLGGGIWNDNLLQNELFRVGGLQSLRGFNENTFFASHYGILTAEYRIFLESETYFFTFFDQSFIRRQDKQNNTVIFPFGTGFGLRFSTQGGIFSFVYALGKSDSQPLGLAYSRIHFGFTSRF
jgi:translocation and assembly module TamA